MMETVGKKVVDIAVTTMCSMQHSACYVVADLGDAISAEEKETYKLQGRTAIAQWLLDFAGEEGETEADMLAEADDMIEFLASKCLAVAHVQHLTKAGQIINRSRRRRHRAKS